MEAPLCSSDFILRNNLSLYIKTLDSEFDLTLDKIIPCNALSHATFTLESRETPYKEEMVLARLFENILPQEQIYQVSGALINEDKNLTLRLLYPIGTEIVPNY